MGRVPYVNGCADARNSQSGVPAGVACTAYVDEAADEGFGRGSRWFITGALIVGKFNNLAVSRSIDDIKEKLGLELTALIHCDASEGFKRATSPVLQGASWQRCRV